jgi:hypothetical protein
MNTIALAIAVFVSVLVTPQPTPTPTPFRIYVPMIHVYRDIDKGIGLTYGHCEDAINVGAGWAYRWSPWGASECESVVEWVPQIHRLEWCNVVVNSQSQYVMGLNEPDLPNQGTATPLQGALCQRQIEINYPNKKIVSHSPSDNNPQWLERSRNAYTELYGHPPRWDALGAHTYQRVDEAKATLTWYVAKAKEWGVSEVWVTEYATLPCRYASLDEALQAGRDLTRWIRENPTITRFAWYGARLQPGDGWPAECITPLADFETGNLTIWGEMYRDQ